MICLGNICRSPMAEGIVRQKALERGVYIELDSCGTSGFHNGEPADSRAISILHKKGIDITNLKSRKFKISDFDEFDELFVMDKSNYEDIISLAPNDTCKSKVKLFLNESDPNKNDEVPDPYYGGEKGFENVYNLLSAAAENFLNRI